MKKIDAYVAGAYIVRFIVAHLIIFGLYISFDLMQRIDMFYEAGAGRTLPQMLVFYLYQLPSNVMDTVPPLLMISAGLVFVHLNRRGELLTLKACGISLRRVALPVFLVTLPVVVLLGLAQEMVIPDLYRQRNLLENRIEGRVAGPFLLGDDRYGYELFVGSFDFAEERMTGAALLVPHPDAKIAQQILEADLAVWADARTLLFERVSIQSFDTHGRAAGEPQAFESRTWPTSLSIAHFIEAQDDEITARAPSMTLKSLRRRIEESPHNPRLRVLFHTRIADKLVPFSLLLIGIPVLVGHGKHQQSRLVGALIAIVVMSLFYACSFIALSFGNAGVIRPALAAWLMPVTGSLTGLVLFCRMRT